MKEFTLEDMTKDELIKVIRQSFAYQPTQEKLRWIRWESMCEQAQSVMGEAVREQKLYSGKRDGESITKWMKASDKFSEGLKLADKADAFLELIKSNHKGLEG